MSAKLYTVTVTEERAVVDTVGILRKGSIDLELTSEQVAEIKKKKGCSVVAASQAKGA